MLFNCVFSIYELCVWFLVVFLCSTDKNSIEENGLDSLEVAWGWQVPCLCENTNSQQILIHGFLLFLPVVIVIFYF